MIGDEPPGARDEPEWPDTLLIPDDPSALHADEIALRRERAATRRRERWYRLTGGARLRAYGISVPIVVVALLAVAGFGALLVALGPRAEQTAAQAPAGPLPTAAAGRPGGRLPAVTLTLPDGAPVEAASLTAPAVLLLVPVGCGCRQLVVAVADDAGRVGLRTDVVEPTAGGASGLDSASRELTAYADAGGRLLAAYGATGLAPTLLLLDAAGAVRTVRTGLTALDAAAALAGTV